MTSSKVGIKEQFKREIMDVADACISGEKCNNKEVKKLAAELSESDLVEVFEQMSGSEKEKINQMLGTAVVGKIFDEAVNSIPESVRADIEEFVQERRGSQKHFASQLNNYLDLE